MHRFSLWVELSYLRKCFVTLERCKVCST